MWTEAGRRSQEAIDSVAGPRPGVATVPDDELPPPTRPLVALRTELYLVIGSFLPATVLAAGWVATTRRPTQEAVLWGVGFAAYLGLLNLKSSAGGLSRYRLNEPRPWPAALPARGNRAIHVAGFMALALAAVVFVAFTFTADDGADAVRHRWTLLGVFVGSALGPAVSLLRLIRTERRLGVRLYREPQSFPIRGLARRAGRLTYAGPPRAAEHAAG